MPIPVSRTSNRSSTCVCGLAHAGHRNHHFPVFGELDGVADQIDENLAQPPRIAAQLGGTSARTNPANSRFLAWAVSAWPTSPAQLRGDPGRLRQVFVDLVSNAVKFTNYGEVVVSVFQPRRDADACGTVGFEFGRDTGIQIDPETQPKLFQVFSQADSSHHPQNTGGSGLGSGPFSKRLILIFGSQDRTHHRSQPRLDLLTSRGLRAARRRQSRPATKPGRIKSATS